MEDSVLFEVKSSIAIITLNRPHRHNAINRSLLTQLYAFMEKVSRREDIEAVVLTGKGRSFCAGVDLDAVGQETLFDLNHDGTELPEIFKTCGKPIVGAINGHAITGGFEIALCCDFLIASERAVFIDSHAKLGIHPGWGITQLLQQAVGRRRAKQISFTSEPVSAHKACEWGLVNEVVPEEVLMARSLEIAGFICTMNQKTLKKIKYLIECGDRMNGAAALALERKGFISFVGNPSEVNATPFKQEPGK